MFLYLDIPVIVAHNPASLCSIRNDHNPNMWMLLPWRGGNPLILYYSDAIQRTCSPKTVSAYIAQ